MRISTTLISFRIQFVRQMEMTSLALATQKQNVVKEEEHPQDHVQMGLVFAVLVSIFNPIIGGL